MIRVENVSKWYGSTLAVDSVSFQISKGEIVGFLGPNGAGKTTVLKMLSTWLAPGTGAIRMNGHDVQREPLAVRRTVGYLPEHNALYEIMRVEDFLRFVGRLRGIVHERLGDRLQWVVEECGLGEVVRKRIQECSKGNRQRVGLAAALIHDPPILLLDEPTHGLDPLQVSAFLDFLTGLRSGRAILFSSHILGELVAVSDRLLIMVRGKLLADVAVTELKDRAARDHKGLDELILETVREGER